MNVSPIKQNNFYAANGQGQKAGQADRNSGQNVPQQSWRKINYISYTGYAALAAGAASGIAAGMKKFKAHKSLAYAAGVLAVIHLGIVEWNKHQYKKRNAAGNANNI